MRFTLRLLLAGVTLLCVGLGIWTHRAREQRRVVELIEMRGGSANYNIPTRQMPDGYYADDSQFPAWLIATLGTDFFHTVIGAHIKDRKTISEVRRLPYLEDLTVRASDTTDDDVSTLKSLSNLKSLSIHGAHHSQNRDTELTLITDRSLQIIAQLPRLQGASLHGQIFSKVGFRAITSIRSLQHLDLGSREHSIDLDDYEEGGRKNGNLKFVDVWRMPVGADREIFLHEDGKPLKNHEPPADPFTPSAFVSDPFATP